MMRAAGDRVGVGGGGERNADTLMLEQQFTQDYPQPHLNRWRKVTRDGHLPFCLWSWSYVCPYQSFMPSASCLKYKTWNCMVLNMNCHFTKCSSHYLPIFIFLWTCQIISFRWNMNPWVANSELVKRLPLVSNLTVSCGFFRFFLLVT